MKGTELLESNSPRAYSTVPAEQVDPLIEILDRLAGTSLARTGDISIEVDGKRYVLRKQDGGHYHAAVVDRS